MNKSKDRESTILNEGINVALLIIMRIFNILCSILYVLVLIFFILRLPIASTYLQYGSTPGTLFQPMNFAYAVYCVFSIKMLCYVLNGYMGDKITENITIIGAAFLTIIAIFLIVVSFGYWLPVANTNTTTLWYENPFNDLRWCCVFQTNNTLTGCPDLPDGCITNGQTVTQATLQVSTGAYMFLTSTITDLILGLCMILAIYKRYDKQIPYYMQ
jgi:hypothetical protein